jgi:SAM-dependent methyltransferase
MTMPDGLVNTFQQEDFAILPKASCEENSRQEFVKSLKQYIQQRILPGLTPVFANHASPRFERKTGRAPQDRHEIRKAMLVDPYFQHYAALNRIGQELLWLSVIDSIERQMPELEAKAETLWNTVGSVKTSVDFKTPAYVTALDIHCMPGGYAESRHEEDFAAGALYDRGVYIYTMGYTGPFNDDLGRSVCNYIRRNLKGFSPTRILDMGCTVGHSTLPYKELFPDAEVVGIDVAGPQIRYAHLRAASLGVDVHFEQQNAEQTDFADGSFDLIVSHILLHETSGKAMPAIFRECHRLLKPGGFMIHADLPPFDLMDEFTKFILDNETYFNNEPFWGAMREVDQVKLAVESGFPAATIRFDTAPMAVLEFASKQARGYSESAAEQVADRDFVAGEFAPGGGWEVLIAQKAPAR